MPYCINIGELSNTFSVPSSVADKHIKLSGAVQLKVLLVALKNNAADIIPEEVAEKLSISIPDVIDALNYWADCGILTNKDAKVVTTETSSKKTEPKVVTKPQIEKPDREEIIKRGVDSPEIAFLMREAQLKFGRFLRPTEASVLLWLHDDEGFSVPLILTLLSFAVNEGKATTGFIERTAVNWIKNGVDTVQEAEKAIAVHNAKKSAWNKVTAAMGIDKRMPSAKEADYVYKWVNEYELDNTMLHLAYETCVDSAGKFSMQYINKIIENWHKNGVETPDDVKALNEANKKPETKKEDSFDLDSYQKMLEKLPE